ncbi:MAG: ankyrin repeat domain-containing protein [Proteobacteria bacterium]|nr:ankyrin repeat domain-containing protein [Pseudomonadota bacterium]
MVTADLKELETIYPELGAYLNASTENINELRKLSRNLKQEYRVATYNHNDTHEKETAKNSPNVLVIHPISIASLLGKLLHLRILLETQSQFASSNSNTPLIFAITNGYQEIAFELLKYEDVENQINISNNYIFILAASKGQLDIVQALLKYQDVRDSIDAQKNAALVNAISEGHYGVVRELLAYPIVQDAVNFHTLLLAADHGHLQILKELLTYEKARNNIDAEDNIILETAAYNGHFDVVLELLKYQKVRSKIDLDSNLDLEEIYENGHNDIVQLLLTCVNVFAAAEMREYYKDYVDFFVNNKLVELNARKLAFRSKFPEKIFDVDTEEAKLYFYIIRNLIHQNSDYSLEDIKILLAIPAVQQLANQAITPDKPNELFLLAASLGNKSVVELLFGISSIRQLVEASDSYSDLQEKFNLNSQRLVTTELYEEPLKTLDFQL